MYMGFITCITGSLFIQYIEKYHPQAELGPIVYFRFASPDGYVELNLNAPQDEPFTGWSIIPRIKPCKVCYTVYCTAL